ncbi:RraA family protein [Maliponia aquimaris]|uniref:Putative 4-hydroxy-4-methyl-2-oxoglutarate aldolase n=1 Tax=Maliponia aquimaris TaxID=1673631 RepID=A0A238KFT8_9RHOB|nr:RraA family protein [Maliponia aquimaris]SMX41670.1 4-hydroxy-4-methyl-2-oxoglutarate aldolase [Maliponia aquimaris]
MIGEPPKLTLIKGTPRPTAAQIAAFQGVETAFLCDAMGGLGAMHTSIGPIGFGRDLDCRAAGPALVADSGPGDIIATLAAVHRLTPGDILVHAAHGHQGCATIGDQLSGMLKNAGAAGFVTDGPMRDYAGIVAAGLPSWCTGLNPNSPFTSGPGTLGGSAVVGGCQIATGDMIVADRNGVVVIPFAQIDKVLARLKDVARLEAELEAKVKAGFRDPLDLDAMLADGTAVEIG